MRSRIAEATGRTVRLCRTGRSKWLVSLPLPLVSACVVAHVCRGGLALCECLRVISKRESIIASPRSQNDRAGAWHSDARLSPLQHLLSLRTRARAYTNTYTRQMPKSCVPRFQNMLTLVQSPERQGCGETSAQTPEYARHDVTQRAESTVMLLDFVVQYPWDVR